MKWIVGTIAIVLVLVLLIGAVAVLGEVGFFVVAFVSAMIFLVPTIGELIIDWFNVQKWNRDYPWSAFPSNLTESDLEILREHARAAGFDQAVMEDLGIMPEGPNGEL